MDSLHWSRRQGHRLLQAGTLLFLFALLVGLAVPTFAVPRLGLSTHLLGIMQGLLLMILGLLWPQLHISQRMGRVGVFLAAYGCAAAWSANLLGAIWAAGSAMLPIAAGHAQGSPTQEMVIAMALRSAAIALIAVVLLVLWGLRSAGKGSSH